MLLLLSNPHTLNADHVLHCVKNPTCDLSIVVIRYYLSNCCCAVFVVSKHRRQAGRSTTSDNSARQGRAAETDIQESSVPKWPKSSFLKIWGPANTRPAQACMLVCLGNKILRLPRLCTPSKVDGYRFPQPFTTSLVRCIHHTYFAQPHPAALGLSRGRGWLR